MVKKLKEWRKVRKRSMFFQIDKIGYNLYLVTDYVENIQYECDFEHLEKVSIALNVFSDYGR